MIPPTTLQLDDSGTYELIAFDVRVPGAMKRRHIYIKDVEALERAARRIRVAKPRAFPA